MYDLSKIAFQILECDFFVLFRGACRCRFVFCGLAAAYLCASTYSATRASVMSGGVAPANFGEGIVNEKDKIDVEWMPGDPDIQVK